MFEETFKDPLYLLSRSVCCARNAYATLNRLNQSLLLETFSYRILYKSLRILIKQNTKCDWKHHYIISFDKLKLIPIHGQVE